MSAFVLERFSWRLTGSAAWVRLPGETTVGTFDATEDAQAEQSRREAETRATVGHPFRCGDTLAEFTTLPEFAFLDWLRDCGVDPPDRHTDGRMPWLAWADLVSDEWTPAQLAHVWEGCNRVRFFRVRERVSDPLYCVLRVNWWREMNEVHFLSESEGGTPLTLWHDRPTAERDRAAKQSLAAAEMTALLRTLDEPETGFDARTRAAAAGPFDPTPSPQPTADATSVGHADVIVLERGEPELGVPLEPLGGTAYVVLRLGWEPLIEVFDEVPGLFERPDDVGGVPVRVFARREEAESFLDRVEAEYRGFGNPYRFRPAGLRPDSREADGLPAAVRDLGIDRSIPDPTMHDFFGHRRACADWWTCVSDELTETQRAGLWDLTWQYSRRLNLYEVREVRVGDASTRPARRVRTLYYVRATNWVPDGGPRLNPHRFLGAFTDRARAEAVRDEAERAVRANPPLDLMPPLPIRETPDAWAAVSSMDLVAVGTHFFAHGLVGEAEGAWFHPTPYWWDDNHDRFSHDQIRAAWQVFDRVRLYEVLPLETEVSE